MNFKWNKLKSIHLKIIETHCFKNGFSGNFFLKKEEVVDKNSKTFIDIQKKKTKPYASRSEQELVGWGGCS